MYISFISKLWPWKFYIPIDLYVCMSCVCVTDCLFQCENYFKSIKRSPRDQMESVAQAFILFQCIDFQLTAIKKPNKTIRCDKILILAKTSKAYYHPFFSNFETLLYLIPFISRFLMLDGEISIQHFSLNSYQSLLNRAMFSIHTLAPFSIHKIRTRWNMKAFVLISFWHILLFFL